MEVLKKFFESKNLLIAAIFLLHLSLVLQLMQKTKIYFQMFSMKMGIHFHFIIFINIIIGFVAAYILFLHFRRALIDNFYANIRWQRKWAETGFAVLMLFIAYLAAQVSLNDLLLTFEIYGFFSNYPFRPFKIVAGMFPFQYLAIPLALICHLTHKNGKEEPSALKA